MNNLQVAKLKMLDPIKIGHVVSKNRVVLAAHSYGFVDETGLPTTQLLDYIVERANGGCGIITLGGTSVSPREMSLPGSYLNIDERILPWYKRIAEELHKTETLVFDQLMHAGSYLDPLEDTVSIAPSPVPLEITNCVPRAMTKEDIQTVISQFALAAKRCQLGELDGVEIKCDQGLLIHQFLSPAYNYRTDEYGGNFSNRTRLLREILAAVRNQVGSSFVIGVRVSINSFAEGDIHPDESLKLVEEIEKLGIDYIHVNGATNATYAGYRLNHGDPSIQNRNFTHLGKAVKAIVSVPVILASMISTPHDAEHVLDIGAADLVAMTRAQIADPYLVKKVANGKVDDIRPCIQANQGCIGNHWKGNGVRCIHNIAAGREFEFGEDTLTPAQTKQKILIIGGGVAGLEFARISALRGHYVELYEKNKTLGGQITVAAQLPFRQNLIDIVEYLELQARKAGAKIYPGAPVGLSELNSIGSEYDQIVLATGGKLLIPPNFNGANEPRFFTITQMLDKSPRWWAERSVLIVDLDWRQNALSVAEWLKNQNARVTLINPSYSIGEHLDVVTRTSYFQRLMDSVSFLPLHSFVQISDEGAIVRNVLTNAPNLLGDVSAIVFVAGSQPCTKLYDNTHISKEKMIRVGDCEFPRGIPESMLNANKVARHI